MENRLIDIEAAICSHEKSIDELSKIVFDQGKQIDKLTKLNQHLMSLIEKDAVKPLSEETPPPHY